MKKLLMWLIVIAAVIVIAVLMVNNNSDSYDSTGSSGTQDAMPAGEVSDLSTDDEVFSEIDSGLDNF